jgi:hypothetical protein
VFSDAFSFAQYITGWCPSCNTCDLQQHRRNQKIGACDPSYDGAFSHRELLEWANYYQVCKDPTTDELYILNHRDLTTSPFVKSPEAEEAMRENWDGWWSCLPKCVLSRNWHEQLLKGEALVDDEPHEKDYECCVPGCVMGCMGHIGRTAPCLLEDASLDGFCLCVVKKSAWADVRERREELMMRDLGHLLTSLEYPDVIPGL